MVFKARKASKVKMAATEETGETERRLVKILIIKMKKGKKRERERPNIWFE